MMKHFMLILCLLNGLACQTSSEKQGKNQPKLVVDQTKIKNKIPFDYHPNKNRLQVLLNYTGDNGLGDLNVMTCYRSYISDNEIVGEATCVNDSLNTRSIRGEHLYQVCPLPAEHLEPKLASESLDLGCGALRVAFFQTIPSFQFEVVAK